MSLRMAKNWQCDIFPDRVCLRDGQQMIKQLPRLAEQALDEVLSELFSGRRLAWLDSVEFWLDNSLAHTLTVPWQEGIATPDELRCYTVSLAQNVFPQLRSQPLVVDFDQLQFGQTALAVTLEQAFWQQLRAAARQQKLRFNGVVTPFQHLLRSLAQPLPASGVFVVAGAEASTFACRSEQQWQHVHRMAFPELSLQQQLVLVKRLSGLKEVPCYCLNLDSWQVSLLAEQAHDVSRWESLSAQLVSNPAAG
ncbi:hypothetical protein AB1287_17245 [Enterobacter asburiae]|uniref:hypothetical protein n=1 Tax=Scandinavium sp. UTDF21-P1B TaxID=3446379 RepID=UPI00349A95A5